MKDYLMFLIRHKGIVLFLPVIAAFFLLGILNHYYINLYPGDYETIKMYVIPNFHLIISLMSSWWIILLFSEFISERGNEVFYLYSSIKSVMGCVIFLEMLYITLMSLYFVLFCNELGLSIFFVILLSGESLFISGLSFFIIQLTKNTSIALGMVSVYCVYLLKFDPMNVMGCISIFPLNNTFGKDSLYQIFIDLGFATIFYLVGGICYKKRKVYY